MIFSELYSVYYNTVAKILAAALSADITERDVQRLIAENAFSESVLTIMPALREGKWQLLDKSLKTSLKHVPTMPLTTLEKRWLKSIMCDPRIKLFGVSIELDGVEPLFTPEDYKVFDKYNDGDPFEDEEYIAKFRLIFDAVKSGRPVTASMINRRGKEVQLRFFPKRIEYSLKDDKFRVIAEGCRFPQFNIGRFTAVSYYTGSGPWYKYPRKEKEAEVVLLIENERNALERVMIHFSHFEKKAERIDSRHYLVHIKYYRSDETEIVIRVLSFGPYVKVIEPQPFVNLIKERLISQKSCELM